tara:strand:- start:3482 stop:4135 length:654 start_codon:yes stop_codon:yes gene_type:complete
MGFKMRSGNKTNFKEMGSSEGSPLEIGKWTGMFAKDQKFIGDEIQARRKAKGDGKKDDDDKKDDTTTTTTNNKPDPKPKDDKKKDDTPKDNTPKDDTPKDDPKPEPTERINRAQRASQGFDGEGDAQGTIDQNVTFDEEGNPRIPSYKEAFSKFKQDADGKYINPRNNSRYDNLQGFIDEAEAYWASQAELTDNEKLKKQNQAYGLDAEGNVKFSKK